MLYKNNKKLVTRKYLTFKVKIINRHKRSTSTDRQVRIVSITKK
jgi:hypothetical protein